MRKLVVTAAAAAFLASGGAAFEAVKHTTGTVKSFDGTAKSLVLDNGSTFTLSKAFKDPGIQAGEKVRAVSLYRAANGCTLAEAKAAIERAQRP